MLIELIAKSFRSYAFTDKRTTKSHVSNQEDYVKLAVRSWISKWSFWLMKASISTHLPEIFTDSDVEDENKETNIIERDEEMDEI